ncbi:metallophosphoesterase family protein [Rhabdochlamydiaceae symbiont of Dictyostelium giganteum]|uniref:metallophosphoesterase family protein n=1 Tax=Rhabdochlamydiaceae symbiont of Dictyostelium giganteum TaxID=3342349 RepID=UPI00384DE86F
MKTPLHSPILSEIKPIFRIAHLSDLHFIEDKFTFSNLSCKSLLGKLNALINRGRCFDYSRLRGLPSLLQSLGVNAVIITGDVSTTSAEEEFTFAKQYRDQLKQKGIAVYLVPGNHDCYTKKAYTNSLFYQFFDACWDEKLSYSLIQDGLSLKKLCPRWWIIGLDTTEPTPLFQSTGRFKAQTNLALKRALEEIPLQDKVMMINHFPLTQKEPSRRGLKHIETLQQILKEQPRIQLYCHGHTHHASLTDLRDESLPLVLDSGSTTQAKKSGWSLIDLYPSSITIQHYTWNSSQWLGNLRETYDMV